MSLANQFKTHSSQAIKSFFALLAVLIVIFVLFYLSLNSIFADYFLTNPNMKNEFHLYFVLFASAALLIFLAAGVGVYTKVFSPIPQVLKRIQDIKNYQRDNESEDYFASLPDFWNLIEEEVRAVAKAVGRRQKQTDRIRKAIEQILNVFPESTMIVDQENRISYFNQAFKTIFSATSESDLFLHDIFREPQVLSLLQDEMSDTINKEIQILPKSSETKKHFMVFKTPFAMKSEGRSREQMVIFHDITKSKKTDQMKTDFVSNVSHELRTPVMSIQGYVQTLKEDIKLKNLDNADKFFEIIESHVNRLTYLINDLLELSSLESEVVLDKSNLNTKNLTQKIIKQFSLDLEKGNYNVEEIYKSSELKAEERLVEQILINLIQNSLRYTPAKTKITIEWDKVGGQTVLKYKDNGPGISKEHLDRIFERFYRIDPHRSRSRGGTGLGLSIVKHIMQKHGGTVEAHSKLGHGLEFNCIFPT